MTDQGQVNSDQDTTNVAQGVTNAAQDVTNADAVVADTRREAQFDHQTETNSSQARTNTAQAVTNTTQATINNEALQALHDLGVDTRAVIATAKSAIDALGENINHLSKRLDERLDTAIARSYAVVLALVGLMFVVVLIVLTRTN